MGSNRPVTPYVPASYTAGTPTPLIVLLHGYGASGFLQTAYFSLQQASEERGFVLLAPNGTPDTSGSRFWNATDACCDFGATNVDDVAYISGLINEAKARFTIDEKRVYLIGHSNGGFMSYRMACDRANTIAAVASLAGAMWFDETKCKPSEPVAVLQIHGTADEVVNYNGGSLKSGTFPGAKVTAEDWARSNGCSLQPDTSAAPRDLVTDTAGSETTTAAYGTGCKPGGHAELWSLEGAPHIPGLQKAFTPAVIDFLYAHPKP